MKTDLFHQDINEVLYLADDLKMEHCLEGIDLLRYWNINLIDTGAKVL